MTGSRVRRAVLVVLVLAVASACTPRPRLLPPVGPRPLIGHEGRWLTDARGRVVTLHGVNYVKKFPPIAPAAAGFGADDARFLRDEGFNAVRLGVVFGSVMPAPGVIDRAYVASIADTVRILGDEGIFTLLDFHQDGYGPATHGNGFPEWATLTDGLPNPPEPFPAYYLTNPALQRAFDNFWADRPGPDGVPLQTHYASALRAVAASVAREDHVLGYDLMNEPWPGAEWQACLAPGCPDIEAAKLVPFGQKMTEAIRRVDPEHLVWSEPFTLFNFGLADTSLSGIGAPQSGLSYHVYAGTKAGDEAVMDRALAASTRGDALLATEFGATNDAATIERLTDSFEDRLLSWTFWSYDENLVRDVAAPPTPANVVASTVGALVVPNPMAVNGTPTRSRFDRATGTYDLEYSTTRPDGTRDHRPVTSVVLPHRLFPAGYTVSVEGARVTGCSTTLVLRNHLRADTVTVHVEPGGPCARPRLPARPA
jgi:endoglycosylceramidase